MTVTKRSKPIQIEPPTITVCPNPGFKPSMSKLYNLSTSFREILINRQLLKNQKKKLNLLYKRNVEELYNDFVYNDGITFNFWGFDLKFGKNYIPPLQLEIQLKKTHTMFDGICYTMDFSKVVHRGRGKRYCFTKNVNFINNCPFFALGGFEFQAF